MNNKPIFLVDLDDNLFQTERKMLSDERKFVAAIDKNNQPRSFMNDQQKIFVDWLIQFAQVIPVTGRSVRAMNYVNIPFSSWKVVSYGGEIIQPNGEIDAEWLAHIQNESKGYSSLLTERLILIKQYIEQYQLGINTQINTCVDGTALYLVAKHKNHKQIPELYQLADTIDKKLGLKGLYIHRNGNNIAWIPNAISKGVAVQYLLNKINQQNFPVIGLGDSLTDYRFLKLCDWFGMPKDSQLDRAINPVICPTNEGEDEPRSQQ